MSHLSYMSHTSNRSQGTYQQARQQGLPPKQSSATSDMSVIREEPTTDPVVNGMPSRIFEIIDTDGGGTISREEWMAAFVKLDSHKRGVISRKEWAVHGGENFVFDHIAGKHQFAVASRRDWRDAYSRLDKDHNGSITVEEWNSFAPRTVRPISPRGDSRRNSCQKMPDQPRDQQQQKEELFMDGGGRDRAGYPQRSSDQRQRMLQQQVEAAPLDSRDQAKVEQMREDIKGLRSELKRREVLLQEQVQKNRELTAANEQFSRKLSQLQNGADDSAKTRKEKSDLQMLLKTVEEENAMLKKKLQALERSSGGGADAVNGVTPAPAAASPQADSDDFEDY